MLGMFHYNAKQMRTQLGMTERYREVEPRQSEFNPGGILLSEFFCKAAGLYVAFSNLSFASRSLP